MVDSVQFDVFPWNSNFQTGIPVIDEQHKQLVHLINTLASHLAKGSDANQLDVVFGELAAYADYHFATEEQVWYSAIQNDSLLIDHKRIHDSFLPKVLEIKAQKKDIPYEVGLEETLKFLVHWLVFHILDNDRHMAKIVLALEDGLSLDEAKIRASQEMSGLMETFVSTILGMYEHITSRSIDLIKEKNERIRMEHELRDIEIQKQAMNSLAISLEKTIEAMAAMVEVRSPYTAGHQRRVASLVEAIGREMGLPETEIRGMYLAASIHDLGDMQIPSEILTKAGKLNNIEYKIIQQHPQVGFDILKNIDFPWPIARIILQHHERLDGSGYPNSLKCDQIIMAAKILAVADVVEAMSSHRPYRSARGIDAALAEIESKKGICYDTIVVDTCIKLFRDGLFEFTK